MSQDIMFPTTSDILPEFYEQYLKRIKSILNDGHSLVLVSKPHREVWDKLVTELAPYKDRVIVRFTIGSQNDELLRVLEPGAPTFEERFYCLRLMFENGFTTSVSMEPAIDLLHTPELINKLLPYCSLDLWVGTLNHIDKLRKLNQGNQEVLDAINKIELNQQPTQELKTLLRAIQSISPKIVFKNGDKHHPDFRYMLGLEPTPFGVAEWGDNKKKPVNYNLLKGCTHDCIYCYAKQDQMQKGIATKDTWTNPVLKKTQPKCYRTECLN